MPVTVVMPKFGLTMQEGRILQWFRSEGDAVAAGEPLFEVETEKVLYEVPATAAGTLARILAAVDAVVPCAAPVAVIALPGEDVAAAAAAADAMAAPAARASGPTLSPAAAGPARAARAAPAPVTPAARRLARERGVDLAQVRGTGPGGRITRRDVEAACSGVPPATDRTEPLHGRRRAIAGRMLASLQTTAQLTITTEADASGLVARRRRAARAPEPAPTFTDLLVEAAARALRAHPRLNATVTGDTVTLHAAVNIGVAIALDDGLVVGVIRDADRRPLADLAAARRALVERARAGTLGVDDVTGGTFTITNLGPFGIDAFTPILHAPQVAILGTGRIVEKPVVQDGTIAVRPTMVLSLTFDHRVLDGAPAARFLQTLAAALASDADPAAAPPPGAARPAAPAPPD